MRGAGNHSNGLLFGTRRPTSGKLHQAELEREQADLKQKAAHIIALFKSRPQPPGLRHDRTKLLHYDYVVSMHSDLFEITDGVTTILLNQRGELHSNGDKPSEQNQRGEETWHSYNQLHHESRPAFVDRNKTKYWYYKGLAHRDNGPAVERVDGSCDFYEHGNYKHST